MSKRPLSRQQIEVARFMAEHPHVRNIDVSRQFNLSKNTLSNWLKREDFCAEIDRTASALSRLADKMPQLMEMAIESGDAEAARLVLEINGMLSKRTEVMIYA